MSTVALETAPDKGASQAAFAKAAALHNKGTFAEAEALRRDAIARDPMNVPLRNGRGVMFAAMKRPREAVWSYRDALVSAPGTRRCGSTGRARKATGTTCSTPHRPI